MRAKYKVYLTDKVYGVLTLSLEIPKEQQALAEALGHSEQEQQNLIGQKLQEFLSLMGNTDEV